MRQIAPPSKIGPLILRWQQIIPSEDARLRKNAGSGVPFIPTLGLCGLGIGSYVAAALVQPLGEDLVHHVGWFLVAFASFLGAAWLTLTIAAVGRSGTGLTAVIVGWAVLLRVALLFTSPSLSDDVYRYVWDGRVAAAGVNPYLYPPSAPELEFLRGPLWDGINHKAMPTPYPPLAEALFAVTYRAWPESLAAMQVLAVLFDLGVMLILLPMLSRAGLPTSRVIVYAWNPLVLVQFAHSAHFDAAMLLPLLGSLLVLSYGPRWGSGALLALSVLVKIAPLVLVPLFVVATWPAGAVAAAVVGVAGVLPVAGDTGALSGILSEGADARFNDSLSFVLFRVLGLLLPDPDTASRAVSGIILLAGVAMGMIWLSARMGHWLSLLKASYSVLALLLLLNAVVEPWYLTWIVPFLCFTLASSGRGGLVLSPSLGWLLLSGTVMLTDLTYVQEIPPSAWVWIRLAEYGPLFALYALAGRRLWAALSRGATRPGGDVGAKEG